MAFFNGTIHSRALGMMTDVAVALPQADERVKSGGRLPVVYLLHGLSDNHSAWGTRTKVELYAQERRMAIVMPEVQRGFYTDMAFGLKYFTYISEELPELMRSMFQLSAEPAHNYIAGLSMGGYGALKCAMTYPEHYRKAASFSGVVDIRRRIDNGLIGENELRGIIGDGIRDEQDLFCMSAGRRDLPPLYLCCGTEDFLIEDNRQFDKHLKNEGIEHIYEEWSGAHEWRFWDAAVEKAINFFADDD